MGQINADRIEFRPFEQITSLAASTLHTMAFTGYFKVGDVVDIVDVDAFGNILSVLSEDNTINAIDPNVSLTFNTSVDTSGAVGTPYVRAQPIDDVQEAIDRLYRFGNQDAFTLRQAITGRKLNTPSAGQTTLFVADVSFFRAGDLADVLSDAGLAVSGTILSVDPNADATNNKASIVIDQDVDTDALTNPIIVDKTITKSLAILRNHEEIDYIDRPIENEDLGIGNSNTTVFQTANLFVAGSSKLLLDGRRLKKGTAGTRATLTQGTSNAQLIYTSMIMGTKGNATQVRVVNAAGTAVTVTGSFSAGYLVSINNNSNAATAQEIADALNADAAAKKIVQVQYGGDGSGAVVAFAATNLATGADNGTGDYAELEQVHDNFIASTGFKFLSIHIRPNEVNRMNKPPKDDEELVVDYRRALDNV